MISSTREATKAQSQTSEVPGMVATSNVKRNQMGTRARGTTAEAKTMASSTTARVKQNVQRSGVKPGASKGGAKASKPTLAKKATTPRTETKAAQIIEMIGRTKGATLAEIMKTMGWQAHSVRGYVSGAAKKHGIKIKSTKNEAGDRHYKIVK